MFSFSLRGLILDTKKGNILKLGKDGFILRWVILVVITAINL